MRYELTLLAQSELIEAELWYEEQEAGVGDMFLARFEDTMRLVTERPRAFPEICPGFRHVWVNPYSYLVVYRIRRSMIQVVSIFHTSLHPGRLNARLNSASDE